MKKKKEKRPALVVGASKMKININMLFVKPHKKAHYY